MPSTLQLWGRSTPGTGCVLGHPGQRVLAGIRCTPPAPLHSGGWEGSTIFRVLGAFGSPGNVLVIPRHSQLWAWRGSSCWQHDPSWGESLGAAWDALRSAMAAWCPWASPAASICQHPVSSGAQPPCPQIAWAAAREGGAAAGGRGKPIAFPLANPGGGTFPDRTLYDCVPLLPGTTGHRREAEPGPNRVPGACACPHRGVRAPAACWRLWGSPARSRGAGPCGVGGGPRRRGRGAAVLPAPAAPSAGGECAFQAAA